jgi:hypothetical protein
VTDEIDEIDRDAFARAIEITRKESPARRQQVDDFLASRPWDDVGRFCASCAQSRSLRLDPWETLPIWVGDIDAALREPYGDARGTREAGEILRRLLDAGLSKYEPDPLRAIAEAEAKRATG